MVHLGDTPRVLLRTGEVFMAFQSPFSNRNRHSNQWSGRVIIPTALSGHFNGKREAHHAPNTANIFGRSHGVDLDHPNLEQVLINQLHENAATLLLQYKDHPEILENCLL